MAKSLEQSCIRDVPAMIASSIFRLLTSAGLSKYVLLVVMLLLIACSTQLSPGSNNAGRILLWHSWTGEEAAALETLLDRFHDIYPKIEVVAAPYTDSELMAEFANQATQGLGPDLLIGDQLWAPTLAEAGFIRSFNEEELELSNYLSSAVNTLRYENRLYGIPLSVRTTALYYNQKLTELPPTSLPALLEHAQDGKKVGLNSNFIGAFWGINAFGGKLLNEQGRLILNEGGFTNWLDWLLEAQNMPNMLVSNDEAWLFEQFSQGEIAYYVGNSTDLLPLQAALGEDAVGVAPLPAGPNDEAGPLMQTEAIYFSTASSKEQVSRSMLLAAFLTNEEQQRKLAQLAGRIPANSHVRIDRRISPAVAGFVDQSKTAVPFRLLPQLYDVVEHGNDAYMQALEGLVDAGKAADTLTQTVNHLHGFPSDIYLAHAASSQFECAPLEQGALTIGHIWGADQAHSLKQVIDQLSTECPSAQVELVGMPMADLLTAYRQEVEQAASEGSASNHKDQRKSTAASQFDLVILPHRQISELGTDGQALNLDIAIEPTFLQRYAPAVSASMRTQEHLFGLPLAINTMVLYINRKMSEEEPRVIGDLLSLVSPEEQLALSYSPSYKSHWGIAAFGGKLFNADGEVTIEGDGFTEWLEWLQAAKEEPGVALVSTPQEALEMFLAGEVAYLVADSQTLPTLLGQLGADAVNAIPLPAGPAGPSAPFVDVHGIAVNPMTPNQEQALALASYLTEAEAQTALMQGAHLIPANMTLENPTHVAVAAIWEQAKTAIALPNRDEATTVVELGDMIYTSVLEKDESPENVLTEFSEFIASLNGARDNLEEEEKALSAAREQCSIASRLLVHPSKADVGTSALEQVAASLIRVCPNIHPSDDIFVTSIEEDLNGQSTD